MKAQVNTSQALKDQTYRVTLFSLLFISSVLFFEASGKNHSEYLNPDNGNYKVAGSATEKSNDPREYSDLDYISSLEACCSNHVTQELEVEKIEKFVETNEMVYYQHILAEFNDIEETEWTNTEVSTHVECQKVHLNDVSEYHTTDDVHVYLNELVVQKNR